MSRRLQYADDALDDLETMQAWQAQPGSGAAARLRAQAILAAIRRLLDAPCRYRPGYAPGTRELIVRGYVVIYEVDPDTGDNRTAGDVRVLRVFGPGQQRGL